MVSICLSFCENLHLYGFQSIVLPPFVAKNRQNTFCVLFGDWKVFDHVFCRAGRDLRLKINKIGVKMPLQIELGNGEWTFIREIYVLPSP